MEAFLLDWGVSDAGHRTNIMQPNVSPEDAYRDVGIGVVNSSGTNATGPMVITQELRRPAQRAGPGRGSGIQRRAGHRFLPLGEGVGNVQITAVNLQTGAVSSTQTWAAGGYELRWPRASISSSPARMTR